MGFSLSEDNPLPPSAFPLRLENISLSRGGNPLFKNLNFSTQPGESIAILGRSGEGKSTLLHTIAGLIEPDSGEVFIHGQPISSLNHKKRATLRINTIGFVMQFSDLIPELSLLENVMVPSLLVGDPKREVKKRSVELLAQVELDGNVIHRKPAEVSGGQRQRAAIARALSRKPAIILADEPTGALDEETSQTILDLLLQQSREHNSTLITVTHDKDLASHLDRSVYLRQGSLSNDI